MFETGWMDEIKQKHPKSDFLFVIEGVLMYFEKAKVKEFFLNLSPRFSGANILFDVTSSWMCKNSHRHDAVKLTNSPFRLDMDDDREIEAWTDNFHFVDVRHYSDFKEWKTSGFVNYWAMKLIPKIRIASRLLHYRIE